mmetsp:Transcript_34568/g.56299  ORF Transcript_34568/g.56299 Transcript_34568/m.56299 type:complete len:378 (+) Transcript_34568:40-1173(+)
MDTTFCHHANDENLTRLSPAIRNTLSRKSHSRSSWSDIDLPSTTSRPKPILSPSPQKHPLAATTTTNSNNGNTDTVMANNTIASHHDNTAGTSVHFQPRVRKFVRCSKSLHLRLCTTCKSVTNGDEPQIIVLKGAFPKHEPLWIQQHEQYKVSYTEAACKTFTLLATIPKHPNFSNYTFQSVICFTAYIVNNGFLCFRNYGPTQTRHVQLWRIYHFPGDWSLYAYWAISRAFEINCGLIAPYRQRLQRTCCHIKKKNKTCREPKNYHLAAHQAVEHRSTDLLPDHIFSRIFSFLTKSRFHVWLHVHEVIHAQIGRSDLVGLEFDANTRDVYVMPNSPALLQKVRNAGRKMLHNNISPYSVLPESMFNKSVELFKAVY